MGRLTKKYDAAKRKSQDRSKQRDEYRVKDHSVTKKDDRRRKSFGLPPIARWGVYVLYIVVFLIIFWALMTFLGIPLFLLTWMFGISQGWITILFAFIAAILVFILVRMVRK